jgi:hypothetical protein
MREEKADETWTLWRKINERAKTRDEEKTK